MLYSNASKAPVRHLRRTNEIQRKHLDVATANSLKTTAVFASSLFKIKWTCCNTPKYIIMSQYYISSVRAKGFKSVGDQWIEIIFEKGLNAIIGAFSAY
jgi:hypothetical protein